MKCSSVWYNVRIKSRQYWHLESFVKKFVVKYIVIIVHLGRVSLFGGDEQKNASTAVHIICFTPRIIFLIFGVRMIPQTMSIQLKAHEQYFSKSLKIYQDYDNEIPLFSLYSMIIFRIYIKYLKSVWTGSRTPRKRFKLGCVPFFNLIHFLVFKNPDETILPCVYFCHCQQHFVKVCLQTLFLPDF